jgi:hypothetical protein
VSRACAPRHVEVQGQFHDLEIEMGEERERGVNSAKDEPLVAPSLVGGNDGRL